MISPRGIQRIIGIGPALCRNRNAFIPPIETFASTDEFLARLDTRTFHDEAILLKGARSFAFERISIMLEAKVHATKLEINMNDVRSNLEQYRRIVGPQVRIMAMVKAFSYGSGGVEMARFLANERIDYLGVAFVDEGIEIRRSGIRIPVMVMNADFQQSDLIIDHHLEPEIYNWSGLTTFTHAVGEQDIHPYPVHLKIDTGMHRLGFSHFEARALVRYLDAHPGIYVKSVFSHLAASDDPASDDFTHLQITRFTEACDHLASKLNYPFLRHILNSSGIERFQQARFDMVRLGIGLYGISSTGFQGLKPIATLRTVISQIHDLDAGESVGYGRLTLLDKPSRIGIVPVGYADGIDRRLGNGNYHMRVNGKPVPTIGNICMDMTLLDLNGMDVREGDEVIVFGPDNPVTEMSTLLDTIPYEILTSISPRVKRIYQFD
jgi:alanine racemase